MQVRLQFSKEIPAPVSALKASAVFSFAEELGLTPCSNEWKCAEEEGDLADGEATPQEVKSSARVRQLGQPLKTDIKISGDKVHLCLHENIGSNWGAKNYDAFIPWSHRNT